LTDNYKICARLLPAIPVRCIVLLYNSASTHRSHVSWRTVHFEQFLMTPHGADTAQHIAGLSRTREWIAQHRSFILRGKSQLHGSHAVDTLRVNRKPNNYGQSTLGRQTVADW